MRVHKDDIRAISTVFEPVFRPIGAELYRFGSRVDETKHGGDIDLLAAVRSTQIAAIAERKVRLISAVHLLIGEQRVDLTIASPERLKTDPLLLAIGASKVRLV